MRVKFLRRTVYDTNGPGLGPIYAEGSIHDLRADEAERWLRRGAVVEAPAEPEPTPEPVVEPAPALAEPEIPVLQPRFPRGRRGS